MNIISTCRIILILQKALACCYNNSNHKNERFEAHHLKNSTHINHLKFHYPGHTRS